MWLVIPLLILALLVVGFGIAVGAVIVGVAACCPRSQARGRSTGRRRPLVTRWIDRFRLVGGVARATLLLVAGLLLLGRVLCWPAGRRW
jgi:hypothetical protein